MSEQAVLYLSRDNGRACSDPSEAPPAYVFWRHHPTAICNKPATIFWMPNDLDDSPLRDVESKEYHEAAPESLYLEPGQLAKLTISMEIIK